MTAAFRRDATGLRACCLLIPIACIFSGFGTLAYAGTADVDAAMWPYEQLVSPQAVALEKNNLAAGGLLQQTTYPDDYNDITTPPPAGLPGEGPSSGGRQQVACQAVANTNPLVLIVAGQSNSANSAARGPNGEEFQSNAPVYNLNIDDHLCYVAQASLLGTTGTEQAFAYPLASWLSGAQSGRAVLIVPIAVGATWIEEWIPGTGHHWHRFTDAIAALAQVNLKPDFILWHQGEANSGWSMLFPQPPTTIDALRLSYMRNFLSIVDGIRGLGVAAPIFPAVATLCGGPATRVAPEIQQAQTVVANSPVSKAWNVHPGPNTDAIPFSYRRPDECHFSHEGNLIHAATWFDVIQQYMSQGHPTVSTPQVSMAANPPGFPAGGGTVSLAWSSQNVNSCALSYGPGTQPSMGPSAEPANVAGAGLAGITETFTYALTCTTASGSVGQSVTIGVPPSVYFTADGQAVKLTIQPGSNYTVSYGSSGASSCTLAYSSPGASGSVTIPPNSNASGPSGFVGSYTFACASGGGTAASTTVSIVLASIAANSSSYHAQAQIGAIIRDAPGYPLDWVGVTQVNQTWTNDLPFAYTSGVTDGTVALSAPAAAGSYQLVYYIRDGYTEYARSSTFTVTAP